VTGKSPATADALNDRAPSGVILVGAKVRTVSLPSPGGERPTASSDAGWPSAI